MIVRPLHRLVVRRIEEGEQASGAISVQDTANEKPPRSRVLAGRFGKVNKGGQRSPRDVKRGDLIPFVTPTSQPVTLDGEDLPIVREDEAPAVIDASIESKD